MLPGLCEDDLSERSIIENVGNSSSARETSGGAICDGAVSRDCGLSPAVALVEIVEVD